MKEHGIIFSDDSVRAILEGRKTQTRRIIKPQPVVKKEWDGPHLNELGVHFWLAYPELPDYRYATQDRVPSLMGRDDSAKSYLRPGDRLWVREAWACDLQNLSDPFNPVFYRADGFSGEHRWKSSIFMPRRLSRLTLDIISIRCEQLQDITIEDCKAEGFRGLTDIGWRYVFGSVWNQFHEKRGYGWNVNPWIWVISFRRMSDGRKDGVTSAVSEAVRS